MEPLNAEQIEARLDELVARHRQLEERLGEPEVIAKPEEVAKLAKQLRDMSKVVETYGTYKRSKDKLRGAKDILAQEKDPDLLEMADEERRQAEAELPDMLAKLQVLLLPRDPLDEKNILLEIRAGTGGEEAALFAGDLFRMYARYAERRGWKMELLESTDSEKGGFREVIANIQGNDVYSRFKFEGGVHRVQRVPDTEAQGRVHTSAATVAIMPEAEDVDVNIKNEDIRVDVYRAQGKGGQGVNTTDSAVRITHLASGLVVTCQDERSQIKNRAKAMKILRARLFDQMEQKQANERAAARKSMVGSGDRSERIRTYNFPQNRLTDHRINLTIYSLEYVMDGDLDGLLDALSMEDQTARLQRLAESPMS